MPQANTRLLRRRRIKKNEPFNFPLTTTSSSAELGVMHDFKGTYTDLERCKNQVEGATFAGNFWLPFKTNFTDPSGDYTLALADLGKGFRTLGTARLCTVPTDAAVAFPLGSTFFFIRQGAGAHTVKGDTGVTVTGFIHDTGTLANSWAVLSVDWSAALLIKVATNQWVIMGNFTQGS